MRQALRMAAVLVFVLIATMVVVPDGKPPRRDKPAPEPLNEHAQRAIDTGYRGPYMTITRLDEDRTRITHHRVDGDHVEIWRGSELIDRRDP